jgi:exodeoxyribonuclease-3
MKLVSWNINGIRAVVKKGFKDFLIAERPAVLCLQEIKISDATKLVTEFDFAGYKEYFNSAKRPGYSGTAILVRDDLVKNNWPVVNGLGVAKFDDEGRVQTLELADFYLINIYFPNANSELSRLSYKLDFNEALLKYLNKLAKKKPLVITGDYNVAHQEIDLARPKENMGSAGFTPLERAWFTNFLAAGYLDSFRELNGEKIQYSWWSFRAGARQRNVGWRIDYFCVSAKLRKHLKKAYILDKITGSDHAPVVLEIEIKK